MNPVTEVAGRQANKNRFPNSGEFGYVEGDID
jgi:hypothetical protein